MSPTSQNQNPTEPATLSGLITATRRAREQERRAREELLTKAARARVNSQTAPQENPAALDELIAATRQASEQEHWAKQLLTKATWARVDSQTALTTALRENPAALDELEPDQLRTVFEMPQAARIVVDHLLRSNGLPAENFRAVYDVHGPMRVVLKPAGASDREDPAVWTAEDDAAEAGAIAWLAAEALSVLADPDQPEATKAVLTLEAAKPRLTSEGLCEAIRTAQRLITSLGTTLETRSEQGEHDHHIDTRVCIQDHSTESILHRGQWIILDNNLDVQSFSAADDSARYTGACDTTRALSELVLGEVLEPEDPTGTGTTAG